MIQVTVIILFADDMLSTISTHYSTTQYSTSAYTMNNESLTTSTSKDISDNQNYTPPDFTYVSSTMIAACILFGTFLIIFSLSEIKLNV